MAAHHTLDGSRPRTVGFSGIRASIAAAAAAESPMLSGAARPHHRAQLLKPRPTKSYRRRRRRARSSERSVGRRARFTSGLATEAARCMAGIGMRLTAACHNSGRHLA